MQIPENQTRVIGISRGSALKEIPREPHTIAIKELLVYNSIRCIVPGWILTGELITQS